MPPEVFDFREPLSLWLFPMPVHGRSISKINNRMGTYQEEWPKNDRKKSQCAHQRARQDKESRHHIVHGSLSSNLRFWRWTNQRPESNSCESARIQFLTALSTWGMVCNPNLTRTKSHEITVWCDSNWSCCYSHKYHSWCNRKATWKKINTAADRWVVLEIDCNKGRCLFNQMINLERR